jgi:hypothetical protein
MGTTCANFHALWPGSIADAAKAVSRAYTKLGYERLRKAPAEGCKQVILLARAGEHYVSVYDSTNADLDSSELKDAALGVSRLLKTGAVFTSLYDSDSYEFIVFNNGRQIDLLMSDVESYSGPLKRLTRNSRAAQWARIFGSLPTTQQIDEAAAPQTAFADDTVGRLSALIGLPGDRAQHHYADFADERGSVTVLYFVKKDVPDQVPAGQISLRNYFDEHNSRKLLVYPAAWPMPVGQEELLTWLLLSEGAGFKGGAATIEVTGPPGLAFSGGVINGAKFHNGQIVGGYELPKDASAEAAQAYLDSKRFALTPVAPGGTGEQRYSAEYPNLYVPPVTPGQTTQIIVILQLHLTASCPGEWNVKVMLRPRSESDYSCELPPARVAAVEQSWLPIVSSLNPRATYDTADIADGQLPDGAMDFLVQRSGDYRDRNMPAAEATAALRRRLSQGREHHYKAWLQDLHHARQRLPNDRRLDYPAIASNVAILHDNGQSTLDVCRAYLEQWLRPFAATGGEVRVRAERQMTEAFHVGKMKKEWPAASVLADRAWARLFEGGNAYQAIVAEFVPPGAEFPIAGMGLHCSLRIRKAAGAEQLDPAADVYNAAVQALTLRKMRGRNVGEVARGHTVHLFNWVINHADCLKHLNTTLDGLKAPLDALAFEHAPLQAWHAQATWIPVFDRAESYEGTVYEEMSVLNFFRGILHEHQHGLKDWRMSAAWCGNVLRMVTPHLWLCRGLVEQLDKAALERVAAVTEQNGSTRVVKRPDCAMEDFELALLPILPIESAQLTLQHPPCQ